MKLDLTKHCIETEIQRLYNQSVSRYLKLRRDDRELEADIELLKAALERFDFAALRSGYSELAGEPGDKTIELTADDNGGVVVKIDGRCVP